MAETTKPATMREAFARAVENLRLGHEDLHAWYLQRLKPMAYTAGVLTVAAPDQLTTDMCNLRLRRLLSQEVSYTAGRDVVVQCVLAETGGVPC